MTVGLGVSLSEVRESMADVLSEDVSLDEIVRTTGTQGQGSARNARAIRPRLSCSSATGREMVLRDALAGWVERQFDVVIVDCPPTLGLLTIILLVATTA